MWKLSGDDIQKAKGQLQEQRAALQAHYDSEVSRLDGELADIERVERFAVSFTSNHKEETPYTPYKQETPSTPAVDPAPLLNATSGAAPDSIRRARSLKAKLWPGQPEPTYGQLT